MGLIELLIVIFVLCPIGGAVAYRIKHGAERREVGGESAPTSDSTLPELREEMSRLAERVDRLAEEQRFLERLLDERPAPKVDDGERKRT